MTGINDTLRARLSAFLDDELDPSDADAVRILAEKDPEIAAELEALRRTDDLLKGAFETMLRDPVPLELARSMDRVETEREDEPAAEAEILPFGQWWRGAASAAVVLLALGAGVGGWVGYQAAPREIVRSAGWIEHVAEYHRVYAQESRHLAEVPASEKDHIEAWIGNRTGVPFTTPDLSGEGLEYAGARLLVASGKPVAQLLYRGGDGAVFAICFLESEKGASTEPVARDFEGVSTLAWRSDTAAYVVAGPEGSPLLPSLAEAAAQQI